jgi:hypothetical protein
VGHHLHEDAGTLQDGLVVVDVSETFDESFDLEFLVELAFEDGGFLKHLHVNIDGVLLDLTKGAGHNLELVLVDSILKFVFVPANIVGTIIATADGSLLGLSLLVLVNPRASRALGAEEVLALVAIVTDVNEIENDMVTGGTLAFNSAQGFLHESSSAGVSGQVQGGMETSVGSLDIGTERQEDFKDFIVTTGSGLMDRGVTVHVLPGGLHVAGSAE